MGVVFQKGQARSVDEINKNYQKGRDYSKDNEVSFARGASAPPPRPINHRTYLCMVRAQLGARRRPGNSSRIHVSLRTPIWTSVKLIVSYDTRCGSHYV